MCHMFLLNVEFGNSFGFSSVTFRPSRVFHSRVFSRPGVDTDEQSTGSCPHFYKTFAGRSGLVVTRLPAAREDPGSHRAVGLCFHENHCDTQL